MTISLILSFMVYLNTFIIKNDTEENMDNLVCYTGITEKLSNYINTKYDIQQWTMLGVEEQENTIRKATETIVEELKECININDDRNVFAKLLDYYCKIKTGEYQSIQSEYMAIEVILLHHNMPVLEKISELSLYRYNSKSEESKIAYSLLVHYDSTGSGNSNIDFSKYITILEKEKDSNTPLFIAITDYIFARSPCQALIALNSKLDADQLEQLSADIKIVCKLYLRHYSSDKFQASEINEAKKKLESILMTSYDGTPLFLAEIVSKLPILRTETIDAFLEKSIHPLVIKRLNNIE